jgi:chaperone modulatory protein CbpM
MSARRPRQLPTRSVYMEVSADEPVELSTLARHAGVRVSLVRRYLAFGLFDPNPGTGDSPRFAPGCAARLATAERMRRDLGLNYAGAVLACELLDRIYELEDRVRSRSEQVRDGAE